MNDQRLVVTWQHPLDRTMSPVAVLAFDGDTYSFDYLESARAVKDFRPLLEFPDFARHYSASELFPVFEDRVLDPQRPDYSRYVRELALDESASPWEQLARSGGASESDTLQLYPFPQWHDGAWSCRFLVNGSRHLMTKTVNVRDAGHGSYTADELEAIFARLLPGDRLGVLHEHDNRTSPNALLVLTIDDEPIGWVPDWLSKELIGHLDDDVFGFTVDRVNPLDAGWHMRVLALLRAALPADHSFFLGSPGRLPRHRDTAGHSKVSLE
ncbi:hypothetical protein QP157_06650 [Sphingomonas sp. LR61]|uniref:hypothetical protein n=1 Tax=Sphingomonas sp. LR61 TaxID=3050234 RepID=UPI002FE38ECE